MKKLFFKGVLYVVLILIVLELVVRVFHLSKDNPSRFVDKFNVEKWVPNQEGYSVTGNRRQNFAKYHINNSGYNSYRAFKPTLSKVEVALVGDSFIEGFHQNYNNSIGKKVEDRLVGVEVYEYGYAGYDFANQMHLINAYKETFDLIDYVILGLKFENDLTRGAYKVIEDRMRLESPMYKMLRKSKLLVYTQNIGVLDPFKEFVTRLYAIRKKTAKAPDLNKKMKHDNDLYSKYIKNFESLIASYGYNKNKFVLLLDLNVTPEVFVTYLNINNFEYIDFSKILNESKVNTTLIYDKHWNNHGRVLVSKVIADYLRKRVFIVPNIKK